MKTFTTLLIAAAVVALGAIGFAYSGLYDVRATSPHSGIATWFLSVTSHASIERGAKDVEVPDLSDDDLARAGASDFDAMCTSCHGAPGKDPEAVGLGMNPPPPDLAEEAAEMSPAELFWVTKYGIRMTGMPAWGATHDDDALWPVVAFMTRLPDMDAEAYQAFLASAEGMGHHSDDGEQMEHSHGGEAADGHEPATHSHSGESASAHEPDAHSHDAVPEDAAPEPASEASAGGHDDGHDHQH